MALLKNRKLGELDVKEITTEYINVAGGDTQELLDYYTRWAYSHLDYGWYMIMIDINNLIRGDIKGNLRINHLRSLSRYLSNIFNYLYYGTGLTEEQAYERVQMELRLRINLQIAKDNAYAFMQKMVKKYDLPMENWEDFEEYILDEENDTREQLEQEAVDVGNKIWEERKKIVELSNKAKAEVAK